MATSPANGCRYWHDCFSCPLPRCLEEFADRRAAYLAQRAAAMRALHAEGRTAAQLAARFRVGRSQIDRALDPAAMLGVERSTRRSAA
jgi:hypothetical protein